ncbi:MAG: cupin domain-containing protein [Anaerolineae bacterium]|nr:cupin domain-containing protein [Anaerolineae bacterium]
MKLIKPKENPSVPTPDHTDVTSQEIAGEMIGAKSCVVKLGLYQPGGSSIFHVHEKQEHVFYILEGALTLVDGNKNEITAHAGEALYVPAGEEHAAFNRTPEKIVYLAVTAPIP